MKHNLISDLVGTNVDVNPDNQPGRVRAAWIDDTGVMILVVQGADGALRTVPVHQCRVAWDGDVRQLAATLYGTYCYEVGGVAFNGDRLPDWAEFSTDPRKQKQVNAWLAAAAAAIMRQ